MLEQALKKMDVDFQVKEDGDEKYVHSEALTEIGGVLVEVEINVNYEYYLQRPEAVKGFILFALVDKYYETVGKGNGQDSLSRECILHK